MNSESSVLINKRVFPAVSIILPIHPQFPEIKIDSEHMIAVLKEIESQLNERYGDEKVAIMMQRIQNVLSGIKRNHLLKSLLIFVSPDTEKVISLPFEVSEKVFVDTSFEIRDLIYAAQLNKKYMLVILSQNNVKTFTGDLFGISYFKNPDMPDNISDVWNEHSFPGWDYIDTNAYDEKNLKNYLHAIDQVLEGILKKEEYPVIIMGDVKLLGYFRQHTRISKYVTGYIDGSFEHANINEIRNRIGTVVEKSQSENSEKYLEMLKKAVGSITYSAGISEVWRSAVEGKGRILLVEKDYYVRARPGDDEFSIIPDDSELNPLNIVNDAVDDVIELVLKNKGEVVFLNNGVLRDFERIALINRY